ncbi:MAG: GIY-YIG nuclease family protein [Glaciimonas sp.]|nr:GIY-YIG nuclease family protein [Glaciimonas sp.]
MPHEPVDEMGFPALVSVSSLMSIAHLFGTSKKRCGIYFFVFKSGFFYIGQAVDVVRRFSQHRRIHDDIVGFSFIPMAKSRLDHEEKTMIFRAESLGLKITNVVHVANIVGDTDFDLVVSVAKQDAWLCAPTRGGNSGSINQKITLPEIQKIRFTKNFSRFEKHPLSDRALALFKSYLWSCVPAPRHTEYSFWSVSCMPSGSGTWPRLLCVSAAVMELFVVGWEKNNPNVLWSFINVAEDVLFEYWSSLDELLKAFPFIEIVRTGYRDAGQHQISLQTYGGAPMEQLLTDPGISKAAAVLALRVMRKRATIYGKYHCVELANRALLG